MNIWEIGNRSGVSRDNIEFYEKSNLLFPTFDEYGCRNYSDTDLETLLRIKLLRQLGISIDSIKQLHKNESELSAILDERIFESVSNIPELEAQKTVCKKIKEDAAIYSKLDAQKYLEIFEDLMKDKPAPRIIEAETVHQLRYPWRRFFARSIDYAVYYMACYFVLYIIIKAFPIKSNIETLLLSFLVFALMIFIEPLLLSKFGTTLGKWIFGMSLRDTNGFKPTYSMGLTRTWGVFAKGYGYNIPIYDLIRNYKSFKDCENGEIPWDDGFVYSIRDTKGYRTCVFLAVYALILSFCIFLRQYAEMPKNRGDISAVEFAENYNDYINYLGVDTGKKLRADGTFEKDPNTTWIYQSTPQKYEIIEQNGVVNEVSFEIVSKDTWINSPDIDMLASVMSYVAVQPKMNIFKLKSEGILNKLHNFQNFEFTSEKVYVSCQVDYQGYDQSGNYLISNDDEDRYYHLVFTMKKLN